ncbi:hypothetical protein PTSG_00243 [Salpingoeca rosetta]|uniref:Translocon-associated protein subunit beta n=1 Tax=Salpingoeca rosetta (strain ATCC 50818 / BSB-021) TaxID=946362 RepID=F2TVX6_SALR5|nr:uncharacterized protein PTSG_00243 [Salpingoeca rosetta]EGD72222.1 hypothetical protein PTSG_00243 [Salpingoeca rosetta]|eukprot:XP_004998793.1 hypothetical protein PTSG_00243 [Salpingoeca rosetta]
MKLFVSTLLVLAAVACAEEARLLVSKDIVNTIAVAERDITVRYSLFNIGEEEAKDISVTDEGFTREDSPFTLVAGLPSFNLAGLKAGANVSHNVIVRVDRPGYYNLTAARVTYFASEDADAEQVAYSSMPRDVPILPNSDFSRVYDTHVIQWVIFLAASIGLVFLPFKAFNDSASKHIRMAGRK